MEGVWVENVDAFDGVMTVAAPLVLAPRPDAGASDTASSKILTEPSLHAVAMRSVPRTLNGAHATSRTSARWRGSLIAS